MTQTPYDWLNKFYNFYMVVVVSIFSGRGISLHTRRGNQPNEHKLALYKPFLHGNNYFKKLQLTNKAERFIKVGMVNTDIYVSNHLKEELTWAVYKQVRVISTLENSKSTKELKGTKE